MIAGQSWVDVFQAVGTVAAVIVALVVALSDWLINRRALRKARDEHVIRAARLVSAWVEVKYLPSRSGSRYDKVCILTLSNESDQPVSDVIVDVEMGVPRRQVGPLTVPQPINTLASRSRREFDISAGIMSQEVGMAHSTAADFPEPRVRLAFSDAEGNRWYRDFSGELSNRPDTKREQADIDEIDAPEQLGPISPLNPTAVVLAFVNALIAEEFDLAEVKKFLDPNASGFAALDDSEWMDIRKEYSNYGIPAHAWFRTDRVAYVRVIHDYSKIPEKRPRREPLALDAEVTVITLVFRAGQGWKIFSLGVTYPHYIQFEPGETHTSIRDYLDQESDGTV